MPSHTTITISTVPEPLADWLSKYADAAGTSRSALLRRLVALYWAALHGEIEDPQIPVELQYLPSSKILEGVVSKFYTPTETSETTEKPRQNGTGGRYTDDEIALLYAYKDKWLGGRTPKRRPGWMSSQRAAMLPEEDGGVGRTFEEAKWIVENLNKDKMFAERIRAGYPPSFAELWSLGKDRHGNIAARSAAPNLVRMLELYDEAMEKRGVGYENVPSPHGVKWSVWFDDGTAITVDTKEEAKELCEKL